MLMRMRRYLLCRVCLMWGAISSLISGRLGSVLIGRALIVIDSCGSRTIGKLFTGSLIVCAVYISRGSSIVYGWNIWWEGLAKVL